jgi:chromosome partitioning protein
VARAVTSVINYKGGVGKTTITANLGAEMAARGRSVLLVDLDPQSSLTFSFFEVPHWEQRIAARNLTLLHWYEAFLQSGQPSVLADYVVAPPAVNAIVRASGGRLDLLPAHLGLIEIDLDLAARLGGARFQHQHPAFVQVHRLFADALREPPFDLYDAVLIDCAPNFNMVTRTALVASDYVLVPARLDFLSTLGIDYLRARLTALVDGYNRVTSQRIDPELLGIVYTMVQHTGSGILKAQQESLRQAERVEMPVFNQSIRENNTAIADAGRQHLPVVLASSRSAAIDVLQYELQQLTSEFLAKTRV